MKLLIHAENIADFWSRYNIFFSHMLQANERMINLPADAKNYECFYRKSKVDTFDVLRNGKVWCEFTVTIQLIKTIPF